MADNFTSSTLDGSYNDDFQATDNYHQILFNNGRALQARELTQLQTILSEQISRFGRNIFKEGAPITNNGMFVDNKVDFVTIGAINAGGSFDDVPVGTVFTASSNGLQARVLAVKPADSDFTYDTLYIQYISNASSTPGSTQLTFGNLDTLTGGGYELISRSSNATGKGTRFSVEDGIYFTLGRFVRSDSQDLYVAPYAQLYDGVVGFKVVQDVVTVNDTTALYDNAEGIVNTTSPGADRYRIRLTLIDESDITSTDTFVFLARLQSSTIVEVSNADNNYNIINDLIAKRTFEESGNYVVNSPLLQVDSDQDNPNNLSLIVSPGVAYVNGYRVENPAAVKLSVPKPQATQLDSNDAVGISYGNYVLAGYDSASRGLPQLNERYKFLSSGNVSLGSARVKAVENVGRIPDAAGNLNQAMKIYLYDYVDSSTSGNIRNAVYLSRGTNDRFTLDGNSTQRSSGITKILEANNNDNLYPVSRPRPEQLTDIIMTQQVEYRTQTNGASTGSLILPQLPAGQSYVDTNLWLVGDSSAPLTKMSDVNISLTNNDRDATIANLSSANAYEVLTYVQKTANVGTKTLGSVDSDFKVIPFNARGVGDPQNKKYIDLLVPDIFDVSAIRFHDSNGPDITSMFTFDNGQRDNYYGNGKLYFDSAYAGALDSANRRVHVSFRHFSGRSGDFYTAQSYPVAYRDIPNHQLADGTLVNLRDFIDTRPDIDTLRDSVTVSRGLPRNGDNLTGDIDYYLPRADKLLMTAEGKVQLLMGQQAENPQFKKTPDNALELYKIVFNANSIGPEDVQITPIEHKRYTMADIAKLEAKLDRHVEWTQLSLLELESKLTPLLDSDGIARTELCIVTDDVSDQSQADTNDPAYCAALDPESNLYRPGFEEENVRLIKDSDLSVNVKFVGDNAYIDHTSVEYKSQNFATTTRNIRGSGSVHDDEGTMILSPSSDEFRDTRTPATRALPGTSRLDTKQAFLWNNWSWNWQGRSIENYFNPEDDRYDAQFKSLQARRRNSLDNGTRYLSDKTTIPNNVSTGRSLNRVVPSNTVRQIFNVGGTNRILDVALLPWIRSRKIYFKATGLKPNTKFTPFFDGTNVSTFCREETFVRWADRSEDDGRVYNRATTHPDGSSDLISDANGTIEGSFFIPNQSYETVVRQVGGRGRITFNVTAFKAGAKEFRLLDITTNNWDAAGSKTKALYSALGAIETKRQNVISTRSVDGYWGTYSDNLNIPALTAPQIRNTINQVNAGGVVINEPHLSGLWGPGSPSVNPSAFTGDMARILSDYIDINQNQNAGNSVTPMTSPTTPFAQSFKVDNQWGVMLTKATVYFASRDTADIPVTAMLVPMVNGKPSQTEIIPGSRVTVARDSVNIAGDQTQISNIQAAGTDFTFDEPVFLQPWAEYALVLKTASTEYTVFVGNAGEYVIGSTSKTFSAEAVPGSLFLSSTPQNSDASTGQDLMFTLTRADFQTSDNQTAGANASLILQHAELPPELLDNNSIIVTQGSGSVFVAHPNHGLHVGDKAVIAGATDTGGILAANINGERTVIAIDANGYQFTAGGGDTGDVTVNGGGNAITSERNVVMAVVNPYLETIVPNDCSTDVSAKFTTGKSVSGSENNYQRETVYTRITPNQNTEFNSPRMIASDTNADNFLQEDGVNITSKVSAYIKIDLKSGNQYVSPVVDLQRASLGMITNCIDDPTVTTPINEVDETSPESGSTGARHISEPIQLEQEAVGFETRVDGFVPEGAGVDFYYRVCRSDEDIRTKPWRLQDQYNVQPHDREVNFREFQYLPGGQNGNLDAFQQVQTKFVMKSTSACKVPLLRKLKTRVLAT